MKKYIYGIIQADQEVGLGAVGLGGSAVYSIARDGLACILSDYWGPEFRALPKEEVVHHLLAHQAVVERVMEGHTILPLKFGALLSGDAEVRDFLSQGRSRLASALAQFQDKVEVEVAATWDTTSVLAEVANQEDIVRARAAVGTMPPGETFQQRVRLGQMVKEVLDKRRDTYCKRMMEFLKPLALDVQPNVLVSDQMVMNVAFLVEKGHLEEFDDRVRQLNDLFQDQINFRIIGPLPPYSFATVEVNRPSPEKIEAARQHLRLGEFVSESQVRNAYRHLAAEAHPDLNPGDQAAGERLTKLREASEALIAYCRGQAGADGAQGSHAITREAVERALLITIRRSASLEVPPSRFGGVATTTWQEGVYGSGS